MTSINKIAVFCKKSGAFIFAFSLSALSAIAADTQTITEAGAAKTAFADPLPQRINFQHPLDNKDIALGEVQAFLQDSQGFMWIGGGGGLVRYDGYEFKFVLQTVQSKNGVKTKSVKMVNHIYEDKEHILWVSTRTGLLRYDPLKELLTPIPDDITATDTISTTHIHNTIELPSGELLVATLKGIFVLDRHTFHYVVIVPDSTKKEWLTNIMVKTAYIDNTGILWLGTGAGLEKVDWAAKKFTLFKLSPETSDSLGSNMVDDIVGDKDGTLWIANSGLVNFDPVTHTIKRYAGESDGVTNKEIKKILFDSKGALWIASDGGGIGVFEKTAQFPDSHFLRYTFEAGRANGLSSNQIRTIFEDRNGDIWVGNYPVGINYFDRSSAAITSYTHDESNPNCLSHNAILAVREDANHNLWLGTDGGGLNFFDREKKQFIVYKNDPKNDKSLSGNSVLDVFIADDGKIWAATWSGGISVLDPATGEFDRMPFDITRAPTSSMSESKRLNHSIVWSIKEDRQKNLWIGSHYGGGLSKLDRKTNIYRHYTTMDNDPTSIAPGPVWSTLEDSNGNFWVGTSTALDLMDRTTGTFTHFKNDPKDSHSISNPSATALFEDSKRRVWIGTEGGLNLLNPDGNTFTTFGKADGFNDDNIRTILEDAEGQLWISTNNGISVLNPETKKIKNYNRDTGRLMGGFHTDSGVVSSAGEIIFGGIEGLRIFDPKKMKGNNVAPPIAFTGLKIFADSVAVGAVDGLLPQSLNQTSALVLDYKKSMFQLDFSALNFRDSSKNNYAYQLQGFDANWLQVGDQRSAKYTNLDAGTYVLKVKGSNNDGVWNDVGKSITIIQLPPPWKTWWAYSLYVLTIIAMVVLFVHAQRKKRREVEAQNRLLEIKVFERTAELREKNNDIQTMLSNMHQGLFTIEVGGNIHPEYSHFLEEIFETKDIAGNSAFTLLFEKAKIGSDTFDKIKASVNAIIGENDVNFEFNSHLLLSEYETDVNGKVKFLSLDWNPVIANDVVTKLMVSVRDVTLLKQMESEADSKKRELDIISQLLNVPAKKYLAFATSAKRFMEENRTHIEANDSRNNTVLALLFRNMHTIKGNCRTYNFAHFSNVVHDVESVYSALKVDQKINWEQSALLNDLNRVDSIFQEYERIYYTVLGRGEREQEKRDQQGFWADLNAIDVIRLSVERAINEFPALRQTQSLLPIQSLLNHALSNPMSEILADIVNSLPSIALQLEKEAPKVVIEDKNVRIKSDATELITNIFAHILRNSIDHGIETAAVRVKAGKPSTGTINVRVVHQKHKLHIHITDDGQGVNIDRLFKKGIEIGKWNADAQPSYQDIANLMFAAGVSTKETVTTISGRGVGMDAVKEFLLAQGGNISLQLLGENANGTHLGQGVMAPFELMVELPDNTFVVT